MQPGEALVLTVGLMFSLLTAGQAAKGGQLQSPAPFDPTAVPFDPTAVPFDPTAAPFDPTAAPFDPTAVPFDPTDMPFDMTTTGPVNSTWLVLHKAGPTNRSPARPGWHGDSFSRQTKRQIIHLLIGAGSGLLLAILLIICITCLLSHFCAAPEPEVRTEFSPRRDGRRKPQPGAGARALSMPEVLRHNGETNKLKVTLSCPPIQETV